MLNGRALLLAATAIAVLNCLSCDSQPSDAVAVPPGPVRLGDLLERATIQSPVTGIRAAHRLEALAGAPRRQILAEDFEGFDLAKAGWPPSPSAAVEKIDGQRVFTLRAAQRSARYGWIVPAKPNTHYVFERSVRSGAPLHADFAVVERKAVGDRGKQRVAPSYMVGREMAIKLHWPSTEESDGTWQRGAVSFFTTPATRALAVIIRAKPKRHEHVFRWGEDLDPADTEAAATGEEIHFDDVLLARVDPTPAQEIALFKARDMAPGADARLGIHKRGQFPPLRDPGDAHSAADDNYSHKYALYAPAPTEIAFPLELGEQVKLYFSVCLARETARGNSARMEVLVRTDGGEESVWTRVLEAVRSNWVWHDDIVDLSRWAGREIDLVLRTTPMMGLCHAMWGNPVVDVPYAGPGPRNVILISVDTLRADRLSSYGYKKSTSPHLDALAADGVRFDNVSSNSNWTCPSFASIFTGLVPARHGVVGFGPATPLPDRLHTLAERFRDAGWNTNAIIYKTPMYEGGYEQGFDISFNVPRVYVRADHNLTEALDWLEQHAGRRNFLFLHFNDPHQPFTQPSPFEETFGPSPTAHGMDMPIHLHGGTREPQQQKLRNMMRGLYDGEVGYVDNRIGMFLKDLKRRGLYDDAIIAFVSDHGEQLWERGRFGHGLDMLHDEVVRVPLIIKGRKDAFPRGRVVETQVRAFDIMPTLLELADLPVEDGLEAETLVPLLRDGPDAPDRIAVTETSMRSIAVRNRHWKYILWNLAGKRVAEALFDLGADAGERKNVAAANEAVVQKMRLQALEYLLLYRPGIYLVAIDGPDVAADTTRVDGVQSTTCLFGPFLQADADHVSVAFTRDAGLLAVADVAADGEITVGGTAYAAEDLPRYRAGDLDRLLRDAATGIHLFRGPPRHEESGPRNTVDIQQLEALKALGYTGQGKGH